MSEKPVRPDDSDCCGSGCVPCIFDVYEDRMRKWELNKEKFVESKALNQIRYLPFLVIEIEEIEENLKVFQFQAVTLKEEKTNTICIEHAEIGADCEIFEEYLNLKSGDYLIMKGIYGSEVISRSYTPVLEPNILEKGGFKIIISLLPNGKMSNFLKKLQTNSIVFWRGPYQKFILDFSLYKHILLFGGGTGVVPLYNIAKTIVEDDKCEVWVKVFAAFKTTNRFLLRKEFGRLMDFWNFNMNVYITNQNQSDFKPNYNESILFRNLDETVIGEEVKKCGEDNFFVIICGPEGFNHFVENGFKKIGIKEENIFIFW